MAEGTRRAAVLVAAVAARPAPRMVAPIATVTGPGQAEGSPDLILGPEAPERLKPRKMGLLDT